MEPSPLQAATTKLAKRQLLGQRLTMRKQAKREYVGWLDRGGVRSAAPLPKPVRTYVKRYGADSLDDLRPD